VKFSLSQEQTILKDTVEKFVQDRYGANQRRQYRSAPHGYSLDNWRGLAELGLLGLPFSDADGGLNTGPRELAAVMEVIRQIAENVRIHRFDREQIMLGMDSAASMLRFSLTALDTNKPISLRVAHFAQFKAGRLRNFRVLLDSFDLVEQALGQPIHLPRMSSFA